MKTKEEGDEYVNEDSLLLSVSLIELMNTPQVYLSVINQKKGR